MAVLKRVSDGRGDSGSRVESIKFKDDGSFDKVVGNRPIVGYSLLVGSVTARSYSTKDYWLTTEVIEILDERDDYIKFKTSNSEYEFWK